jgi:hypothetical protein
LQDAIARNKAGQMPANADALNDEWEKLKARQKQIEDEQKKLAGGFATDQDKATDPVAAFNKALDNTKGKGDADTQKQLDDIDSKIKNIKDEKGKLIDNSIKAGGNKIPGLNTPERPDLQTDLNLTQGHVVGAFGAQAAMAAIGGGESPIKNIAQNTKQALAHQAATRKAAEITAAKVMELSLALANGLIMTG